MENFPTSQGVICRTFKVGLIDDILPITCRNRSSISAEEMNDCVNNATKSYHLYWTRTIASMLPRSPPCTGAGIEYSILVDLDQLMDGIDNGTIDFLPCPLSLDLESSMRDIRRRSIVPMTIETTFYANIDQSKSAPRILDRASFLMDPFSIATWLCVLAILMAALVVQWQIDRYKLRERLKIGRFLQLLTATPFLIGLVYNSELKAAIIRPSSIVPFRSIAELGSKIQNGEIQLVLERFVDFRHSVLAGQSSVPLSNDWQQVIAAVRETYGALLLVDDTWEVCEYMRQSARYIYFGDGQRLFISCTDICFWKFAKKPYPDYYPALAVSDNAAAKKLGDLAVHALKTYYERLRKVMLGQPCLQQDRTGQEDPLDSWSLLYAFLVILIGWTASLLVFALETFRFRPGLGLSSSKFV